MYHTQTTSRTSFVYQQHNRTGEFRNEAPAYARPNRFGAQDRHVEEYARSGNSKVLPPPPATQPNIDVAEIFDDGEPTRGSQSTTFIFRLFDMVEDASVNDFIRWNQAGDSIFIPDIENFKANALGNYFNISFESFVRQLNGYSFKKTDRSKTTGTYKHRGNKFRRGCRQLLHEIRRVESQQRRISQQDELIREPVNNSDSFPTSHPSGLSDTPSTIHRLEQENKSLKEELGEVKEDLGEVKEELGAVKEELGEVKGELGEVKAALRALDKRFQDFLSLFSEAPPATNSPTHIPPLPTSLNVPEVAQASYSESDNRLGSTNIPQPTITNWAVAGVAAQIIPSVSRPPVTALFPHPHYATPAAALPSQHSLLNVEPSPPSSAVRLPADPNYPLSPFPMPINSQYWQASSPGIAQPTLLDSEAPSGVITQNGPTPGLARPARGSPRSLNIPTVVVQRRQPRSDTRDPGPSSTFGVPSQIWPWV
ncbi:Heat stress transcription factor A-2c [Tulasnella sp. UAMH 9824]|nr:Heat stress transcription factor A-2c [Tulasnella sp. UAMH 9824]